MPTNKHNFKPGNHKKADNKTTNNISSEAPSVHNHPHHYVTRKIKNNVFHQTIDGVRPKLDKKEQSLSKLIHRDGVEKLSNFLEATIARPNAILGASTLSLVAGLVILLFARVYGFEIPLSTILVLYIVGYIATVLLELVHTLFKAMRSR